MHRPAGVTPQVNGSVGMWVGIITLLTNTQPKDYKQLEPLILKSWIFLRGTSWWLVVRLTLQNGLGAVGCREREVHANIQHIKGGVLRARHP